MTAKIVNTLLSECSMYLWLARLREMTRADCGIRRHGFTGNIAVGNIRSTHTVAAVPHMSQIDMDPSLQTTASTTTPPQPSLALPAHLIPIETLEVVLFVFLDLEHALCRPARVVSKILCDGGERNLHLPDSRLDQRTLLQRQEPVAEQVSLGLQRISADTRGRTKRRTLSSRKFSLRSSPSCTSTSRPCTKCLPILLPGTIPRCASSLSRCFFRSSASAAALTRASACALSDGNEARCARSFLAARASAIF
jgi:hypothetical protein